MTTRVEPPQLAILLADNERLRALAASVIHDFNNFAAAIGGYSELVLQRLASDDERVSSASRAGRRSSTTAIGGTRRSPARDTCRGYTWASTAASMRRSSTERCASATIGARTT